MARVTVEDCVKVVQNRFDLVVLAAQRSREVSAGAELTRERGNDKNPVVALREIAEETVKPAELLESLLHDLQKHVETDEPEEDDMAALMSGDEWRRSAEEPARPRKPDPEPEIEVAPAPPPTPASLFDKTNSSVAAGSTPFADETAESAPAPVETAESAPAPVETAESAPAPAEPANETPKPEEG